jgi:hypothetical protein
VVDHDDYAANGDDAETVWSYEIGEQGFQSPIFNASAFHYHTPDEVNTGFDGDDPAGLSGTSLYDVGFFPGLGGDDGPTDATGESVLFESITALDDHGNYYWYIAGPGGFENTLEVDPLDMFGSSDYFSFAGQDEPQILWDTLPHQDLVPADVADWIPPNDLITLP